MAANLPTSATATRRPSIQLPRPLWIGIATGVLIVVAFCLRIGSLIHRQRLAIAEIERLGGEVTLSTNQPEWLRPFVADAHLEVVDVVTAVRFGPMLGLSSNALSHLRTLALCPGPMGPR